MGQQGQQGQQGPQRVEFIRGGNEFTALMSRKKQREHLLLVLWATLNLRRCVDVSQNHEDVESSEER